MGDKYYIPNLQFFLKNMDDSTRSLIKKPAVTNPNVIEIKSMEDTRILTQGIQKSDFFKEQQLYDLVKKNFPEVAKQITKIPMDIKQLKDVFQYVFTEIPEDDFENSTTFEILKKTLNTIIRKGEIEFLILNIHNGKLLYDESRIFHTKTHDFHYNMLKSVYDLDTYYPIFCNTQSLLENVYLKEITFNNKKINRKNLNLLNSAFNFTGNNLADFKIRLNYFLNQINGHRVFLKRTTLPAPKDYKEHEQDALESLKECSLDVDEKIKKTVEAREKLKEEIEKRKWFLSWDNAKTFLQWVKLFRGF